MEEYKHLLQRLEMYKKSHPNLYQIWVQYLNIKKEEHEKLMKQFHSLFNNLERHEDINNNLIPEIYFYYLATKFINT